MVSEAFKLALLRKRLHGTQSYRLARAVGVSPSVVSAIVHNVRRVEPGDPIVIALGALLGLQPDECFAADEAGQDEPRLRSGTTVREAL